MHLLAWTNSGYAYIDLAIADEGLRDVGNQGRGNTRNVRLTATSTFQRCNDRVDSLLQTQQKPRHVGCCNGYRSTMSDLFVEERNDGAPRGQHVSITHADESRSVRVQICAHEQPFLYCFGHSHYIDGFARFVGRNPNNSLNIETTFPDGADDVFSTDDIRLHCFKRKVFTRRNLFESSSIEDYVRIAQGCTDAVQVADVADAKLQQPLKVVIDHFIGDGA